MVNGLNEYFITNLGTYDKFCLSRVPLKPMHQKVLPRGVKTCVTPIRSPLTGMGTLSNERAPSKTYKKTYYSIESSKKKPNESNFSFSVRRDRPKTQMAGGLSIRWG